MRARYFNLLAALALCGANAAADEPEPGGIATVAVNGHYDNTVGTSDAASQGVIRAELIANRPALRTGEVLEFVPGLIVSQHSGDGKANQYYLRGFNLDHGTDFATYVDGMPVNMRTHAHGHGYSDLNFLLPDLVKRIAYKKGPYFADEGDFASAGAAHIRLADTLERGIASLSVGAHGYRRALLADSVTRAGSNWLYGLEAQRNDGPWALPERLRQYKGLLRYSTGNATDGLSVTAMSYRNRWQATDQVPQRAVASGLLDRFGTIDDSDGGIAARDSLSAMLRKPLAQGRFSVDVYAIRSRLDLYSNFTYFLADPVHGDQFSQSERRRTAGLNARYEWQGQFGDVSSRTTVGLQARHDRLDPVALHTSVRRQRTALVREDRVRESSASYYVENSTQWLRGFRTVAGVRQDRYRFDVASSNGENSGRVHAAIASPKLSLIFGPWRDSELFINGGRGFHSNDARGTTQARAADGSPSQPVTPLVPTRGAELGLRTEALRGLQSSLALWRLDIDSELVFVVDAGETQPSRASRRSGIEWNNHYVATSWLLFDLDLAVSRARYRAPDGAGRHIPGSLGKVASFGATVTDRHGWSGSVTLRYFGPRPLSEDNSVRSSSTALAHARIGYRFGPGWRLTLDVFNLLDRKASDIDYFYASRLKGEPAEGVEDVHYHPVEPRSARVSLSYAF